MEKIKNKKSIIIISSCIIFILLSYLFNQKIYKSKLNIIFSNQINEICEKAIREVSVDNGYFSIDFDKANKFSKNNFTKFYNANSQIINKNCTIKNIELKKIDKQKAYLEITVQPKGYQKFLIGKNFKIKSKEYCLADYLIYLSINKTDMLYKDIKINETIMLPEGKLGIVRKIEKDKITLEVINEDSKDM